jgi:hypothetical protein
MAVALIFAFALFGRNASAQAERPIALLIGNGTYQYLPRLLNPVNNAQLIAATPQSVGFQLIGARRRLIST